MGEGGRQYGAAAAAEHEPEGTDEFGGQFPEESHDDVPIVLIRAADVGSGQKYQNRGAKLNLNRRSQHSLRISRTHRVRGGRRCFQSWFAIHTTCGWTKSRCCVPNPTRRWPPCRWSRCCERPGTEWRSSMRCWPMGSRNTTACCGPTGPRSSCSTRTISIFSARCAWTPCVAPPAT